MTNGLYNTYRFLKLKSIGYYNAYESISLLSKINKLGLFDIHKTSIDLSWEVFRAKCNEIFMQNAYYGISRNIKEYSNYGINKPFFFNFEHGLYLGDNYVSKWDLPKTTNSLFTFGEYRKSVLLKFNVKHKIHLIGPYIHYVKPFLNASEFSNIKSHLGKTLLVFPSHSTHDYIKKSNSDDKLLNFINEFAKGFDSVLVCLYWKDIILGYNKMYENKGYTCVSAGHMFDYNFLSRLKSIIQLSDFTISNDIGTHIGYCISENKPHYIVETKIQFIKDEGLIYNENYNNILSEFSNCAEEITNRQLDIVNLYWGLEHKKTKEELITLIDEVNNHYNTIKKQKYHGLY